MDIIVADLAFALDLADVADRVTLPRFRAADLRITLKGDESHVTDADEAAEDAIREAVARSGRGEAVLGEETGGGDAGDVRWIVDPIDGTSSFAARIPIWATLLALERGGETTVGVASAPALGRRWWATRRRRRLRRRVAVSRIGRVTDRGCDHLDWFGTSHADRVVRDRTSRCGEPRSRPVLATLPRRRRGSGCRNGLAHATLDHAAVRLIVEEAGGRCTTWDGTAPFDGCTLLSTNGLLHDEVVATMRGL